MAIVSVITGYIIPFLLVLSFLVFIHEMGHYLVGRWCGIRVTAFSIGFGPEIVGFTDGHGTRWKLSLIPLGGYVRFLGDEDAASRPDLSGAMAQMSEAERAQTLGGAKLWKRALTVAAGPIANFVLAILIFAVVFSLYGRMVADPVVAEVRADSAAQAAGVAVGDRLVALDGREIRTFDDVRRYVSVRPETEIIVTVERAGQVLDLPMVPKRVDITDQFGNRVELGQIGIVTDEQRGNFRRVTYGPLEAIGQGFAETGHIISGTFQYLGNIFAGKMSADQIGGPIRIAETTGQVATLGFVAVLNFAAVISVSLGLMNLFPIPVLDGGHLVLYALEAVRGRPLSERLQETVFRIGFALLLTLMVFATWNDTIGRWIG
ncbi:RIP metalloprotease RseP [Rhizobium sp. SSA_523]|uniref:RIP metalloprotease RseP n=1 Tax=Rhizobium sp. SSA_523 TaxID=2952477 RepID=UPI0020907ED3|nr:RIP metalloprotease RseP [Rhizobium sp. SSA_523]MCO5733917.1 RIP metalloprotease RseP [Rhizobium sp. SSA_523]WKC24819.1 RIP metalloprotease RseP [Rhizobium sp. SSA_523]